jgi:hypothetical protein
MGGWLCAPLAIPVAALWGVQLVERMSGMQRLDDLHRPPTQARGRLDRHTPLDDPVIDELPTRPVLPRLPLPASIAR